jgi:FtsP/CotA-like multicopper oxidase with cupredoxin domain
MTQARATSSRTGDADATAGPAALAPRLIEYLHPRVDESRILRFGDIGLRVNSKFEAIDALCFSSFRTPPEKALYLQLYHELQDMGMCINGRQWLGNTPTVVAGRNTLMRFGLVAMNEATFHTFHLHGHRWAMPGPVGTDRATIQSSAQVAPVSQFEDTRIFGPANSFFFAIKEGDSFMRAEPPKGEWHMHCHVLGHMMEGMMGSLLVVDEGDIFTPLPHGKPCPEPMSGGTAAGCQAWAPPSTSSIRTSHHCRYRSAPDQR